MRRFMTDPKVPKLLLAVGGLFVFFLLYGVIQEKIMTKPYGVDENGVKVFFTVSAFLVLNNRVVTMVMAVILAIWNGESTVPMAPLYTYFGVSISNFVATFCQYEALKFVSFPTQTLGKCGKIFPVLILGTLGLGAKKYGKQDYIEGFFVTLGCLIFLLSGDTKAPQKERDDSLYGLLLMGLYLFSDGFTSTLQEKLFKGYQMTTYNQMIYVNGSSAILSLITLFATRQFFSSIDFMFRYPALFFDAFILSLCAMFGQQVIYYIIKEFGALVFATAMTTRQFVGILLSCMLYVHPLSLGQWAGTALVAAALYYKALTASHKKKDSSGSSEKKTASNGGDKKIGV